MRLEELDFAFSRELIAQSPAEPRDSCRLLRLGADGSVEHHRFTDITALLRPGDTLVFNDSRVLPARVEARKETGGRIELLFLHPLNGSAAAPAAAEAGDLTMGGPEDSDGEVWEVLARPSHRLRAGGRLQFGPGVQVTLGEALGEGRWSLQGPPGRSMVALMEAHGNLPLPPYIRSYPDDPESYQTVYADKPGSAAAPTAGLHFTPALLRDLAEKGVDQAHVTLHVGLDTFLPIREEVVERHRIHRETWAVTAATLDRLRAAEARGGRLVAVGTTATRVLETIAVQGLLDARPEGAGTPVTTDIGGQTQIFITPGYRFKAVDALLTNFHLPRSTVLALTMAFAGAERLRAAYEEAIAQRYRFFSFGDAMLIDRPDGSPTPGGSSAPERPSTPGGSSAPRG